MSLSRSWSWELRGARAAWLVGALFLICGAVLVLAVPAWISGESPRPAPAESYEAAVVFRILGWTFLGLGGVVLGLMIAGVWVGRTRPEQLHVWHWWVGLIGGLLGAALFAVPATFAFPFMLSLGRREQGRLFPDVGRSAEDLWIAGLFSILGLGVLVALWFVVRLQLASSPRGPTD